MGLAQYIKDTRSELNHVAWPTRVQTLVYTILVVAISILVSLYLGLFDFLFTTGLGRAVELLPHIAQPTQEMPIIEVATTTISTTTPQ